MIPRFSRPIPRYPVLSHIHPFVTWNVLLHICYKYLAKLYSPRCSTPCCFRHWRRTEMNLTKYVLCLVENDIMHQASFAFSLLLSQVIFPACIPHCGRQEKS